jgi:RNA-directed DNA polymerase
MVRREFNSQLRKLVRQLQPIKMELRRIMDDSVARTGAWVRQMLKGHLNYYAVPGNDPSLRWFVAEIRWRPLKILKRGSQLPQLG